MTSHTPVIFLLVLLVSCSSRQTAPSTQLSAIHLSVVRAGPVAGTVVDAQNRPIKGAVITAEIARVMIKTLDPTDEDGRFEFQVPPNSQPSRIVLTIEAKGYKTRLENPVTDLTSLKIKLESDQ
jgi:hypothetical protein